MGGQLTSPTRHIRSGVTNWRSMHICTQDRIYYSSSASYFHLLFWKLERRSHFSCYKLLK